MKKIAAALFVVVFIGAVLLIVLLVRQGQPANRAHNGNGHDIASLDAGPNAEDSSHEQTLLKAKSYEQGNNYPQARKEYLEALKNSPANVHLIDGLGEFYRKHGEYASALQTWAAALPLPGSGPIWIKALFWSKAAVPSAIEWSQYPPPEENTRLKPLITYLLHLRPGEFWNEEEFERLADHTDYLSAYQETFWLKLLQALKSGHASEAQEYLENNAFASDSWDPKLENALKFILAYQQNGLAALESHKMAASPLQSNIGHPLDRELSSLANARRLQSEPKMSEGLAALLKSSEAFSAAFLAEGWFEAALQLNKLEVIPENFPSWYAAGLTEALQTTKGPDAALEFALRQNNSQAMRLIMAETLIANGNLEAGRKELKPLAQEHSNYGVRAAWLLSKLELEEGLLDEAKQTIHSQPILAESVMGKEVLAKIALRQGNVSLAESIYRSLLGDSREAEEYFSHDNPK